MISNLNRIALAAVLLLIPFIKVSAQTSSPDAQMNEVSNLDPQMDGNQAVAVSGTNVYAVFSDTVFGGAPDVFLARSVDGGMTFEENVTIFSDPEINNLWASVAVGADGTVHLAWTAITPFPEVQGSEQRGGGLDGDFNIWYSRSTDNGLTFSVPVALTANNGSIMPIIGIYENYVHVMYVLASNYPCADYFVITSDDGGDSFGVPVQLNDGGCLGTLAFEGLSNMTVASDGTVHAVWQDTRRAAGSGDIFTARSTDHGQSFGTNVMVNELTSLGVDAVQFYPSIAADDNDHVYVSFTDLRLGSDWEDHRVYLAVSVDGGDTFAEEVFLAGLENDLCKYHKIAVSETGELVAVLLSTAGMLEWGVYYLVSQDGGTSFTTPFNLSDVEGAAPNELSIFVTDNGTTHAVWADEREGQGISNLYHSKTDHVTSLTAKENSSEFTVFPNPTHGDVFVSFEKVQTVANITVADSQGRVVFRNSIKNFNRTFIDLDIPAGFYTLSVATLDDLYSTKLLIVQ